MKVLKTVDLYHPVGIERYRGYSITGVFILML